MPVKVLPRGVVVNQEVLPVVLVQPGHLGGGDLAVVLHHELLMPPDHLNNENSREGELCAGVGGGGEQGNNNKIYNRTLNCTNFFESNNNITDTGTILHHRYWNNITSQILYQYHHSYCNSTEVVSESVLRQSVTYCFSEKFLFWGLAQKFKNL